MPENKTKAIKNLKPKVEAILRTGKPELRDNDGMLVARYWTNELREQKLDVTEMTFADGLILLSQNKLTDPEDIVRARRILQKKDETLRGATYNTRHGMADDVKENINKEEANG